MQVQRDMAVAQPEGGFRGSNSSQLEKYIENLHNRSRGRILRNLQASDPHPTSTVVLWVFCFTWEPPFESFKVNEKWL